jgi:signal transduction histidine kinase
MGVWRRASLRTRLLWLVGAALLPVAILDLYGILVFGRQQQAQVQQALVERARAITSAVDNQLSNSVAALQILALSKSLDAGDIKQFYADAASAAATRPDWDGVILVDLAGNRLLNTRLPYGAPLPGGAPVVERESFEAILTSGQPLIGNLAKGPGGHTRYPIRVPVIRNGTPKYILTAVVKPDVMLEILRQQKVPAESVSAIFDGNTTVVARSRNQDQYIGTQVSKTLRLLMANTPEGWGITTTLEGQEVYSAFSRSNTTPWGVALGIPQDAADAPIWRSYLIAAAGIVLSLALGAILSALLASRIARPIGQLRAAAQAVGRGEVPAAPPAGIPELDEVSRALTTTAEGLRASEDRLRQLNATLEARVEERTQQLEQLNVKLVASNKELEAFSYSVSHDLRAPLRSIRGFSQALLEDNAKALDAQGKRHLQRVREAGEQMSELIDGLLALSRIARQELKHARVDLTALAHKVAARLRPRDPEREVDIIIAEGMTAQGDTRLLEIALDNLLDNAWKFTSIRKHARIEFGQQRDGDRRVFFVRDNGAGFDMTYVGKLFGVFERLHTPAEFEGIGVGLATVKRVIERHNGRVWAEGAADQGATFYFTLGEKKDGNT